MRISTSNVWVSIDRLIFSELITSLSSHARKVCVSKDNVAGNSADGGIASATLIGHNMFRHFSRRWSDGHVAQEHVLRLRVSAYVPECHVDATKKSEGNHEL